MKKIIIILVIFLLLPLRVKAAGLDYVNNGETSFIQNGLVAKNTKATLTNDAGTTSTQNISVLKNDGTLMTTVWSYVNSSGSLVNRDVLSIAKDFEEKNPGYEVMAAVNGDYFNGNQTINANVIYGSKLLNAVNHNKYFSIELTPQGGLDETYKTVSVNQLYAYFYDDETSVLQYVTPLLSVNQRISKENQTAIFYNYSSINNTVISHYQFDIVTKYVNGQNYAFSLDNVIQKEAKIETTTTKISLETANPVVSELLSNGSVVKVQQRIENFDEGNTMIGVGSSILVNKNVRTFDEIKDQGLGFSSDRHPRTGIGFDSNNQPILFTVDGRQASSAGVNLREFALIMKENGAVNGFNLDGGGSTQAVIKRDGVLEVYNEPLLEINGKHRTVANAILFIKPLSNDTIIETKTDRQLSLTLPSLNYEVFVNNELIPLINTTLDLTIDADIDTAISVVNKTSKYSVYQRVYYKSTKEELTLPTFEVSTELIGSSLKINVSFVDPDELLDRMYIIHQETEERQVALIQHQGVRSATFKTVNSGENVFTIYYELSNGDKKEITHTYLLKDETTFFNTVIKNPMVLSLISLGVIGISAATYFAIRGKKK